MDLKQLTALVTVAEVGSITKAARLLHLVQPSVTRQIRSLEDELGVSLFRRVASGMTPTPEGALFVERARRVLLELDRARAEIRPDPGGVRGVVTLGCSRAWSRSWPSRWCERWTSITPASSSGW